MRAALAYADPLGNYRFGPGHPMRPERFTLAVELMRAWELLEPAREGAVVLEPSMASDADLLRCHTPQYLALVRAASANPDRIAGAGIGPGDTPAFPGMHAAAALAVGATCLAVDAVLDGRFDRTFAPAGGLHHAHADRASGFCVYNDVVVAIERALAEHPGLRVAYVDIDAHHGDGVESAFAQRPEVLTLSIHESGAYLFPGTGRASDIGVGAGTGSVVDVPLPPHADPACYELVVAEIIEPALTAFAPDLIVAQIGADSHRADPLTHLHQSVAGFAWVVSRVIGSAEALTDGRIVLTGGGGYTPFSEVPRMWAAAMALLLDQGVPAELPGDWLATARDQARATGWLEPTVVRTFEESIAELDAETRETALQATRHAIRKVREYSPLLV